MSIALVVTRGFSNGTLTGTIADVVRRGYQADAASVTPDQLGGLGQAFDRRALEREADAVISHIETQARAALTARERAIRAAALAAAVSSRQLEPLEAVSPEPNNDEALILLMLMV